MPAPDYIEWPEVDMDDIAEAGVQKERVDGAGSETYPHAKHLLHRLAAVINAGEGDGLKALFIAGANPCYSLPDIPAVKEAFNKIPLKVSFSSYLDETAEMADYVLPNHVFLERFEDVPIAAGLQQPMIGLAKPVVQPQYKTRHTGDVIIGMAQALGDSIGEAFPWESYEACLEETLGDNWDTLNEEGYWVDDSFSPDQYGRFRFAGTGTDKSPKYEAIAPEGEEASFPLLLIPYDSIRLANGFIGDPPFVLKTVADHVLKENDICVEINPETAKKLGLRENATAMLTTPKGQAKVRIHRFDGIMPGVVAMPTGLGHTAYDGYLKGKGVNVNDLIGPVEDPASGFNAAWGIRAKLSKA
jgi:anaerobic selenocysteine-containing dehydrogenase